MTEVMVKEGQLGDHSDKDTKQTILQATVELIREEGFQCATLRKIAARADTNLALVNYYFGSKDNLLGDAVQVLISTFDDAFEALEDNSLPPQERLKQFFICFIGNLEEYPGLAGKMLEQGCHIMGSQVEYAKYWRILRVKQMHNAIKEITNEHDEGKLTMMMMQLYGAVVFPVMLNADSTKDTEPLGPSFRIPSIEDQLESLLGNYFHKYN